MEVWDGWGAFGVPGEPRPEVSMAACDAVEFVGVDAVGFVYRRLSPQLWGAARMGWEWRVDEGPPLHVFGEKERDRPLAVHVLFAEAERARAGAYAAWRLRMFGFPKEAYAVTYVWGGAMAAGAVVANPYHERGRLVVLRDGRGGYGEWRAEEVDLRGDFARVGFGAGASAGEVVPVYVVVSSDTDDSGGRASARLRGMYFANASGERAGPCG